MADAKIMDWDRLRMFTDGDPAEEESLIGIFIMYSEESLTVLGQNMTGGENPVWREAAHKLKGSAANLGAERLREVCLAAEQAQGASAAEKTALLAGVRQAYAAVYKTLMDEMQKNKG